MLKELAGLTGAAGVVLVDREGEQVASHSDTCLDMPLIGAHKGVILNAVKELSARHWPVEGGDGGHIRCMSIITDTTRLAVCALAEGLALVVVLEWSGTPMARVLFECRRAARLIEKEIG